MKYNLRPTYGDREFARTTLMKILSFFATIIALGVCVYLVGNYFQYFLGIIALLFLAWIMLLLWAAFVPVKKPKEEKSTS